MNYRQLTMRIRSLADADDTMGMDVRCVTQAAGVDDPPGQYDNNSVARKTLVNNQRSLIENDHA
ncbi:MAG: hypothetical protein ABSE41_05840 [Bacteroidota bacterium]